MHAERLPTRTATASTSGESRAAAPEAAHGNSSLGHATTQAGTPAMLRGVARELVTSPQRQPEGC